MFYGNETTALDILIEKNLGIFINIFLKKNKFDTLNINGKNKICNWMFSSAINNIASIAVSVNHRIRQFKEKRFPEEEDSDYDTETGYWSFGA